MVVNSNRHLEVMIKDKVQIKQVEKLKYFKVVKDRQGIPKKSENMECRML